MYVDADKEIDEYAETDVYMYILKPIQFK